jgi:hypothetical protein
MHRTLHLHHILQGNAMGCTSWNLSKLNNLMVVVCGTRGPHVHKLLGIQLPSPRKCWDQYMQYLYNQPGQRMDKTSRVHHKLQLWLWQW